MRISEPFVPESVSGFKLLLKIWKGIYYQVLIKFRQKSPKGDGEILYTEIQRLVNFIWNKEEFS
jgi:hypothetical protein